MPGLGRSLALPGARVWGRSVGTGRSGSTAMHEPDHSPDQAGDPIRIREELGPEAAGAAGRDRLGLGELAEAERRPGSGRSRSPSRRRTGPPACAVGVTASLIETMPASSRSASAPRSPTVAAPDARGEAVRRWRWPRRRPRRRRRRRGRRPPARSSRPGLVSGSASSARRTVGAIEPARPIERHAPREEPAPAGLGRRIDGVEPVAGRLRDHRAEVDVAVARGRRRGGPRPASARASAQGAGSPTT